MCHLKKYDFAIKTNSDATTEISGVPDVWVNTELILKDCMEDCTKGLEHVDSQSSSNKSVLNTKSKLLYRRAKAYYFTAIDKQTSSERDDKESNLNKAAKDLLLLLSFDETNKEAAELLQTIKRYYGMLGGGRSKIARALDFLRTGGTSSTTVMNTSTNTDMDATPLMCLRTIQSALSDDTLTTVEDIGKNGGVPLLLSVARHGIDQKTKDTSEQVKCRIASLHILSACCSHDSFIIKYALRDSLPPATLAQIVEEEDHLGGSSDVVIASMALLIRLIVHWDHREVMRFFANKIEEDGTIKDIDVQITHVPEVDRNSVCRVAIAALSWGRNSHGEGEASDNISTPRAALDLLSAWTASDLDALDAASDACFDSSPSITPSHNFKKAAHVKVTPEEMRQMKPRQVAAYRKREAEYRAASLQRAIQHITMFCNQETGGLDAMLGLCARTNDHRLRREVGLQIGRLMSVLEQDDHVKKLVAGALGCPDWKGNAENAAGGLETLTIEELDDEEEGKECFNEKYGNDSEQNLFRTMKRGQLTASLLIGRNEVGTWALKQGWSNGNGVQELKQLIASNDSRAMSVASELVSGAASVESARPMLAALVEEGTLDDLLVHPDSDVRSGAASCAAKIGLASKALSEDEGEVMELLDVAIELLFDDDETEAPASSNMAKKKYLPKLPRTNSLTETTSMDRGIEVITYLASKTFVKDKIANGYKPKGSPPGRKSAIQRLVEIACAPNSGDAQMAFGLAGIFNLISVSIETLQKEAFVGKEITKEQYDQLQALGKTEEEKDAEAKKSEKEGDNPKAVTDRIQKLANAYVPRALVKLLEGSNSDSTQQKLLEAMGRLASEQSVRGMMIQQGCLSACINMEKGVSKIILLKIV